MPQPTVLPNNQSALPKAGVNKPYKALVGNAPQSYSSDRSMHAPHSKSSISAQHPSAAPTVTVTAGRADPAIVRELDNTSSQLIDHLGSNARQVDRLGVPQKEDSGTESGEDLRFIAAGLRDQLQLKSDSNIIEEVTCALSRLESSLKDGKDISVDTEKRKALLALVGRLQAGLTSPERLAEIAAAMSELDGHDAAYGETSSPEADTQRSGKQRFAKRRNRVSRHTVGVSREELADARRYMEDMILMGNMSQGSTSDGNAHPSTQWFPLEKNASSGAILIQPPSPQEDTSHSFVTNKLSPTNGAKRRPVSGDFSVSFEPPMSTNKPANPASYMSSAPRSEGTNYDMSDDGGSKFSRFANKKLLMKRANTIDLAKAKRFGSDFDTDSDAEDKSQLIGLKRAVHPSVKKRAPNVLPPFEPKTENDRKFLAFINKQSDKPGLGWNSSRSVSNWTNKFGSIKHNFEMGAAGSVSAAKPPQVPAHYQKVHAPYRQPPPPPKEANLYSISNQQIAQRLHQEAERQAEERRRKMEYERREHDKQEHQRLLQQHQQQQERMQRQRFEKEYYERHIREHEKRTQPQAQHTAPSVPKPIPVNEFKHAPQSVFRPIDSGDTVPKTIYKPIPQLPLAAHSWQPSASTTRGQPTSPSNYSHGRPDNSFITSPPPSKSPIGLPWAAKPAVDSTGFKTKAHKFEESSKYDNYSQAGALQRHNSLRAPNAGAANHDDFKKRPSLPNTSDPYGAQQPLQQSVLAHMPPPTNISIVYNNRTPRPTYLSYPCLPTAVTDSEVYRNREDSLTNPQAEPLVLTNANPSYCPSQNTPTAQLDIASPADSRLTSPSISAALHNDYTDDDFESDSPMEYRAISKVMGKPQSQTAVTIGRRAGHVSDDEVYGKNSKAAKNLLSTMKSIGNGGTNEKRPLRLNKRPEMPTSPKTCLSPDGRAYQAPLVEPLFPNLATYDTNRQPVTPEAKLSGAQPTTYTPSANYGQPLRGQPGMYKSLENLSARNQGYEPMMKQSPQLQANPYVSETQASYVVTYPIDDTTDDEEVYRQGQKAVPDFLPVGRSRNISETSNTSSNTASLSYSTNLPSPNTSWTANPIITDASPGQNIYTRPDVQQPNYVNQMARSSEPQVLSPMSPQYQYPSAAYSSPKHTEYTPSAAYQMSYANATEQQRPANTSSVVSAPQIYKSAPLPGYDASPKPLPPTPQAGGHKTTEQPKPQIYSSTHQSNHIYENVRPMAPQKQVLSATTINGAVSQPKQTKAATQAKTPTSTSKSGVQKFTPSLQTQTQETVTMKAKQPAKAPKSHEKAATKKTTATMRKSVSEDYGDVKSETFASERILTKTARNAVTTASHPYITGSPSEPRRKSAGNAFETQQRQMQTSTVESNISQRSVYKSSAPADTPDIVKSSLPKDENQPILKKFGPPQRHHYMPNSYKSPLSSSTQSSAFTPAAASHIRSVESSSTTTTTKKSILKASQHTEGTSKPLVVENPATPQPDDDYIPRNIVYNNVHAFASMSKRQDEELSYHTEQPARINKLSKSDSWKQIISLQNQNAPQGASKFPQPPFNELRRTKSGHALAGHKLYEAAIDKTEISEKQRTMAAYFAGSKSPTQQEHVVEECTRRSAINRTKTSEKLSASRKSTGSSAGPSQGGLTRSATMPHIANLNLLDESNVEDAFEQLIMGS